MAKRSSKKSSKAPSKASGRKSNAETTIAEGRQYVENFPKAYTRGLKGTKTMKQIVKASGIRVRTKKVHEENSKKTTVKKTTVKKTKGISKKTINQTKRNSKSQKKATTTKTSKRAPKKTSAPLVSPVPSLPPVIAPTTSVAPVARTGSKASNTGRVAQLSKSKSKDAQIPAFGFIDVCFCVDSTGSMSSQLAQVQQTIKAIITNIQTKVRTQGLQLRFAVVSYRDHPPQDSTYVTKHLDFTDQFEAIQYLKTLQAFGGGDEPEAAHDGLLLSAKNLRWAEVDGTPVLRYIFHIADAPPHGKQFLNPEAQEGCLCGLQTDDIIRQINKKSIHYRLIKARANAKLNQMQKIFRSKIGDFDSTDIGHARQLNVKVSDMIIHEVLPDYA